MRWLVNNECNINVGKSMPFEFSPAIAGGVAGAVCVPIILAILKKIPAFQIAIPDDPAKQLPELSKKYAKWEMFAIIPVFLSVAIFTYVYFKLFTLLIYIENLGNKASLYYLSPSDIFWFLPAFFLAIVTAALPCHLLYSFILKDRYEEYTLYCNLRYGYDGWKIFKKMTILIVIIILITLPFAINCYSKIGQNEMIFNPFFGLREKRYNYSQLCKIKKVLSFKAPNGNVVRRTFHDLTFSDGYIWSTKNSLYEIGEELENEIVKFVSDRSGKPIEIIDPYPIKKYNKPGAGEPAADVSVSLPFGVMN